MIPDSYIFVKQGLSIFQDFAVLVSVGKWAHFPTLTSTAKSWNMPSASEDATKNSSKDKIRRG